MVTLLEPAQWQPLEEAHHQRVDAVTGPHLQRARRGERHPVMDFLFTYYNQSPAKLRRWHPGHRTALRVEPGSERLTWKHMTTAPGPVAHVDVPAMQRAAAPRIAAVRRLVSATHGRTPQFTCFGLHEWAMVYRQPAQDLRHHAWPLRLSRAETDDVVEAGTLRCTHFDAFRFFTEAAVPRNAGPLSRQAAVDNEQPGCLHAGMDLYRFCYQLAPAVSSDLTWDAFRLALDIRELDMQAAPYDLRALGYEPVPIETAAGRAEYVRRQRGFSVRGQRIRERLLAEIEPL